MSDYEFQEYPKHLYHATLGLRVVQTRAEQEALGDGWAEHPDLTAALAEKPKKAKKAEP